MRIFVYLFSGVLLGCAWAQAGEIAPPSINIAGDKSSVEFDKLPEIVARVEERTISRTDLIRELVASGAEDAVMRLALRKVVDQAAEKAGVTATSEELDALLKSDKTKLYNQGQLKPWETVQFDFENYIRTEYQMSMAEYRDTIARERLLTRKILGKGLVISPAELKNFFVANPKMFQPSARYHAAHILITPLNPGDQFRGARFRSPAAQKQDVVERRKNYKDLGIQIKDDDAKADPEWEATRQSALICKQEIESKRISWEQAVSKYTQDPRDQAALKDPKQNARPGPAKSARTMPGELGWYTENGPMVPEFYEATKNAQKGDIIGPFRTQFGWHIVRMIEVEKIPLRNFDACRAEVESAYFDLMLAVKSEEWLAQLQQSAAIEYDLTAMWPDADPSRNSDPVVAKVNGEPILRSALWRELLRLDGPDTLQRLVNMELALGPLKRVGSPRLEWESLPANRRSAIPPPVMPVFVDPHEIDLALTDDRLKLDEVNTYIHKTNPKAPFKTLEQFVFEQYGKSIAEYQRALESAEVLYKSVKLLTKEGEERRKILLLDFYKSDTAREFYKEPQWFDVAQIFWEAKKDAGVEARINARKMAELFKKKLLKGANWGELAASTEDTLSRDEGGVIGELRPGNQAYPDLYNALKAAKPETGQLVIVETRQGVHLVKIRQVHKERVPDFEEVKGKVERDYMIARSNLLIDIWIRALKAAARVETFIYQENRPDQNFTLPDK